MSRNFDTSSSGQAIAVGRRAFASIGERLPRVGLGTNSTKGRLEETWRYVITYKL